MQPQISDVGDGEVIEMEPGSLVRFKIFSRDTDGLIELYERELPPYTIGADPHLHLTTTETFYVVEGCPVILCGETERAYSPGAIVVVPPNTVHGYGNPTDQHVKVLISFTPALGHEEFFRGLSELKHGPAETYAARLAELRQRFGSVSISRQGETQ
jgi:mannose-6-phosphate isomerase-like protein (cupin superfamily)